MMTPLPHPDARLAEAIARAEKRREVAEQLAGMGMALARALTSGVLEGTAHPNPRHDVHAGFAAISRAVRLSLRLEEAIDKQILAWCKGEVATVATAPPVRTPWRRRATDDGRREQARDAVRDVVEREVGDAEEAAVLVDTLHARLIEGDGYDRLLEGEFNACVESICRDLGVEPRSVGEEDDFTSEIEPDEAPVIPDDARSAKIGDAAALITICPDRAAEPGDALCSLSVGDMAPARRSPRIQSGESGAVLMKAAARPGSPGFALRPG